jgi:hypothetical protein
MVWPSTAIFFFQAWQNETGNLPYQHALLHESTCVLKYHPFAKPAVKYSIK